MQIVLFFLILKLLPQTNIRPINCDLGYCRSESSLQSSCVYTFLYDTTKWRPRFRMLRQLQCHIVKHITDFRTGKEEDNGVAAEIETTWLSA